MADSKSKGSAKRQQDKGAPAADAACSSCASLRKRVKDLEMALDAATRVTAVLWMHNGTIGAMCIADDSDEGRECVEHCCTALNAAAEGWPASSKYRTTSEMRINVVKTPCHVPPAALP